MARWFRYGLSVSGPFVCRCLTSFTMLRFHFPFIEPTCGSRYVVSCIIALAMKTLLFVALTIVLGVALGIGTAVLRIRTTPWNPNSNESVKTTTAAEPRSRGPMPKVAVDRVEYNFGALDMQGSGSHDFILTNVGDAPLTLAAGGTSCRCTMSSLEHDSIQPGGSAKVTVTWKPRTSLALTSRRPKFLRTIPTSRKLP